MSAIALVYTEGAYNTISYNSYKKKKNDQDFCVNFNTLIHHHIDPEVKKLVVNDGFTKNETLVISKNNRHTPDIAEFIDDYVQVGNNGRKLTFFENTKNTENSGFITFSTVK